MTAAPGPHLVELPTRLAATRDALHRLAFFALAPRRYAAEERLGLVALPGGFGTPWFDDTAGRTRVRIDGDELVVDAAGESRRTRPTSVRQACRFLDVAYHDTWFDDFHDPLTPGDPDAPLTIDTDAAGALAAWFAFGTAALEQLAAAPGARDPSTVQLWPEHFDLAVEVGSAESGQRASYGASPGDAAHDQPYLYVAPWGNHPDDDFWNDPTFGGASCTHARLAASDDPFAAATTFLRHGHGLVTS